MKKKLNREVQCPKCPWKKDADPHAIIGYSEDKHKCLHETISDGTIKIGPIHAMACHESDIGSEEYCVGWLMNQLGSGNNIALRLRMRSYNLSKIRTSGPQHEQFEDTLPKGGSRALTDNEGV